LHSWKRAAVLECEFSMECSSLKCRTGIKYGIFSVKAAFMPCHNDMKTDRLNLNYQVNP